MADKKPFSPVRVGIAVLVLAGGLGIAGMEQVRQHDSQALRAVALELAGVLKLAKDTAMHSPKAAVPKKSGGAKPGVPYVVTSKGQEVTKGNLPEDCALSVENGAATADASAASSVTLSPSGGQATTISFDGKGLLTQKAPFPILHLTKGRSAYVIEVTPRGDAMIKEGS